jgi:hypothetical protein
MAHFGIFSQCAWLPLPPGESKIVGNMMIDFLKNLRAGPRAGAMGGFNSSERSGWDIRTPVAYPVAADMRELVNER